MPRRKPKAESRLDMTYEVYVHVPFCLRRCGYCDFNTYTSTDLGGGASRGNYATMVIREMTLAKRWQLDHGIVESPASSVFFGGGTPTVLPANDLVAMLNAIRDIWGLEPGAEITTEANPDTVDADYIKELADGGFTRISFGMQSAVPHVLRTLDRTHTPENVEAGVRAADAARLASSVDLIYGAPGESLDDWRTSVRAAIDLGVNHISAYALTVEPTTKMGRRIAAGTLPKPDDDDEAAKYEIADDLFTQAGLSWYEISNWARPGYESRHNLGYWHSVDWAGLGPGAHSHYRTATPIDVGSSDTSDVQCGQGGQVTGQPASRMHGGFSAGLRAWDIAHPRLWGQAIADNRMPWADDESIGVNENLEERIMLSLRIREGLDVAELETASGIAISQNALLDMVDEGLIVGSEDRGPILRVVPTRKGRLLNDLLIARFYDLLNL